MLKLFTIVIALSLTANPHAFAQDVRTEVLEECRAQNLKISNHAQAEYDFESDHTLKRVREIALLSGNWIMDHPEMRALYFGLRAGLAIYLRKKVASKAYAEISRSIQASPRVLSQWTDLAPKNISLSPAQIHAEIEIQIYDILKNPNHRGIRPEMSALIESDLIKIFGAAETQKLGADAKALAGTLQNEFKRIPKIRENTLSEAMLAKPRALTRSAVWKMRGVTVFGSLSALGFLQAAWAIAKERFTSDEAAWEAFTARYPEALLDPEIMHEAGLIAPEQNPYQIHCQALIQYREQMNETIDRLPRRLRLIYAKELKAIRTP